MISKGNLYKIINKKKKKKKEKYNSIYLRG